MRSSLSTRKIILILLGSITFLAFVVIGMYTLVTAVIKTQKVVLAKMVETKQNKHVQPSITTESVDYDSKMTDLYSVISLARNIFPIDTVKNSKQKTLEDIKGVGLYYWGRSFEIIQEIETIPQSKQAQTRTKLYKEYCQLNKDCYELMYKAIEENSSNYDQKIESKMMDIDMKLTDIRAINNQPPFNN